MAKNLGTFTPSSQLTDDKKAKINQGIQTRADASRVSSITPENLGFDFNLAGARAVANKLDANKWEGGGAFTQIQSALQDLNYAKQQQQIVLGRGASQGAGLPQVADYDETIRQRTAEIQNLVGLLPENIRQAGGIGSSAGIVEANPFAEQSQAPTVSLATTGRTTPQFTGGNQTTPSIVDYLSSVGQPSDQASRAKLAEQLGIKDYNFTADQNTAMLNMLRGKQPPTPSGITSETMESAKSTDLSGTTDGTGQGNADSQSSVAANQIKADIENRIKLDEETKSEEQKQAEDLRSQNVEDIGSLVGKSAFESEQRQKLVDPLQSQLNTIKNKLEALNVEKDKARLDREGQPMTLSRLAGAEARQNAIFNNEILSLTAQGNALLGNIEEAEKQVGYAVDAKYGAIEESIAIKKAQLEALAPTLNAQEKIRADVLTRFYAKQDQEIADKKQKEKDIQNVLLQYYNSGGKDPNVIKGITSANSMTDALMIYGTNIPSTGVDGDYSVVNFNGEDMILDKNLGTLTSPNQVSESDTYFTDANGISWNIEGWATDQGKAASMQKASDDIGKVTDENIDAKVKQFTPGLTADMIRETSAKTGVSWEALMAMVVQESTGGNSPVAKKNNNFAGLTWSKGTQWQNAPYNGVKGTGRGGIDGITGLPESGNYTRFPTPQAGLNAMGALMAQKGTVIPQGTQTDSEVQGYLNRVNSGDLTDDQALKQITESKKKALIIALSTAPKETDTESTTNDKQKITTIDGILNSGSLNDIVGRGFADTDWGSLNVGRQFGDYWDVLGNMKNVTDQLTLDKLIEAKKAGATFGALSNVELQMLSNAATAINNFAMYREPGVFGGVTPNSNEGKNTLVGYRSSEKEFKKQLNIIKQFYQTAIERKGGDSFRTMGDGSIVELQPDGNYKIIN